MIFLGIDIGREGAICAIDREKNIILLEDWTKKEDYVRVMGGWEATIWEPPGLWDRHRKTVVDAVYCLKESPLKWMSKGKYSNAISIGINIGKWDFWLSSSGIISKDISPREWQSAFPEFQFSGGKERGEAAALREIPECRKLIYGPRGALRDGRTDAILLAVACKLLVERKMF